MLGIRYARGWVASVPGRVLSQLLLSAPCQNIWCELPATPSFEGTGRGGTGHLLSLQPWGKEQRGRCPTCGCCFSFSTQQLHTAVSLKKITVCFPDGAGRRNPDDVTSMRNSSCLSLATCAHVCRDAGQVVSPGTGRPPQWGSSVTAFLPPGKRGGGRQQRILIFSQLPVLLHPSLKLLVVAGNHGGAQAGSEVLAEGSAGSGQDPVYFSVKDIVISYGFSSRCVCCK